MIAFEWWRRIFDSGDWFVLRLCGRVGRAWGLEGRRREGDGRWCREAEERSLESVKMQEG